jgi:RNA polymerase sigma-70 factor (ECF subfamily)
MQDTHDNRDIFESIADQTPYLRLYACSLTRNAVAADDLVQECLTRAFAKAHTFTPGTNLRAWLSTILHNLHINEVRRQGHWGIPLDVDSETVPAKVAPVQDVWLALRALERALRIIPDEQRVALILVGAEGMSYEEVAELLDIPVGTVKSRVSRGREALRCEMGDRAPQEPHYAAA